MQRASAQSPCYATQYKLFECLILNRLAPVVEPAIIPQQAGFQPGKSTTWQVNFWILHSTLKTGSRKDWWQEPSLLICLPRMTLWAAASSWKRSCRMPKSWHSQTSSEPSWKIGASMLSLTTSKVTGDDNGTACLKVACWLHYYITSTPMTSQWTRTLSGSSTLTTSV